MKTATTTTTPTSFIEKNPTKREKQRMLDKQLGLKRSDDAFTLPVDSILMLDEDRDDNPRNSESYGAKAEGKDKMSYEELKASLKANGQEQPIFVYFNEKENAYALAHGWQRTTAMKELSAEGEQVAPMKCMLASSNREERMFLHFTANMHKELNDNEKAVGINRLHTVYKVSLVTISKKLGIAYQKVVDLASLMQKASTPLKEAMAEGVVSITTAKAIVKEAADTIEQNEMLESGVAAAKQEKKKSIARKKTADAAVLAQKEAVEAEVSQPNTDEAPVDAVEKAPRKPRKNAKEVVEPQVEAGKVYTADDINDDEVSDIRVKQTHIAPLATKLSVDAKLVIALKRAFDMGDKVNQPLVSRVSNLVAALRDPEFAMTNENIMNMFAELNEEEENHLLK